MQNGTHMDVLLRFQNGAVMLVPIERGKPVDGTFRLTGPEGAIFMFNLIDELPSGRLVFKEWEHEAYVKFSGKVNS